MPPKQTASPPDLSAAFEKLKAAAKGLPGVEEGRAYGTPAIKAGGKLLARVKDADTVVLRCEVEEKALLIDVAPDIYFETDHYRGWPMVLVRIHVISVEELAYRLGDRRP